MPCFRSITAHLLFSCPLPSRALRAAESAATSPPPRLITPSSAASALAIAAERASLLSKAGRWLAAQHTCPSAVVVDSYLRRAAEEAPAGAEAKARAYYRWAAYSETLFQVGP